MSVLPYPVPVQSVEAVWPRVEGWLSDACAKGDGWWTIEEVERRCRLGQVGLWLVLDGGDLCGAIVTEIETWPTKTVATLTLCGGEGVLRGIGEGLPAIEEWAKAWGAAEMHVHGRPGWARSLKSSGYEVATVTLRKVF
jgi:hypothetical protein